MSRFELIGPCTRSTTLGRISVAGHRWFVARLTLSVVFAVVTAASAHSQSPEWPRFLGERFDGASASDGDDFDWSIPPAAVWSLPVGDGYGLGAISGGQYFHFDGQYDRERRQQTQRLRCVDMATGKTLWETESETAYQDMYGYEDGPRSGPTIDRGRVFVYGVDGLLECRNQVDGTLVWSLNASEEYGVVQSFFGVGGAPLIVGDAVIVMVGGSPAADAAIAPGRLDRVSPDNSLLVAFDVKDGTELWKCGDDLASYSSPRTIQIDGKTFVLIFARDHLMMVDPVSGSVNWKFRHRADILESVNAMVPLVSGDRVLVSECYDSGSVLLKVSVDGAEVVWQDPVGDRRRQSLRSHWSGPALVDGALYGCSGRNPVDSEFRCLDFDSGNVLWSAMPRKRSSVTRVGSHLLVWQERGALVVVRADKTKFDQVAEYDMTVPAGVMPGLSYPCWAAPIVVEDKLLIRGDRNVVCFQLAPAP